MAQLTPRTRTFHLAIVTLEWLGLLVFAGLFSVLAALVAAKVAVSPWWILFVIPMVPLGFIAADLVTGFGHFFADNFCSEDSFLIGHALVFRFRQHHEDQRIICTLSFRELNGGLAGLSLPWLVVALFLVWEGGPWAVAAACFLACTALFMAATNQIHRWAHEKAPPAVRWLQRHNLILSPQRHAVHHKAPHDVHFCISSGWLNPLLDRIRFWHHAADLLVALRVPQADESVMGRARRRRTESSASVPSGSSRARAY